MFLVASIIFWFSVAVLIYAYAGFAALVAVVGRIRNRRVRKAPITPTVTLIIAAYNEEREIANRLENALALDYPSDALEIIVASDGSDDQTESIVARYASRGVRLLSLPRRGKMHALNAAVRSATAEILVFSDANSMYDPQALRKLLRNFADPEVGGVAGNTVYRVNTDSESSSRGENLYWSYDKWLKRNESLTGNTVSAHGGIYAIRGELYRPVNEAAVTDDFVISTEVVEQGYRLVFEDEALAYEEAIPRASLEFHRKVRIISTGLHALAIRKRLLNPLRYGFYSVILFSHKLVRRFVSLPLLALLPASIFLSTVERFFLPVAAAQALFYGMAGLGYLVRDTGLGQMRLFCLPFFYCMANAAALAAVVKLACGQRIQLWQPQRHAPGVPPPRV